MKRIFILSIFCLISGVAFSQVKIGLRFSPSYNINRVSSLSDTLILSPQQATFKMVLGIVTEFAFTDTYSFTTGLAFAPKSVGINFAGENGGSYTNATEEYKIQYLQIPVLLKLYTDDYLPGSRIYFHVGAMIDVKIFDSPENNDYVFIEKFLPVDASAVLGVGTDVELGISTIVFGGLSYNRGLTNMASKTIALDAKPIVKSDYFQLELGLKF
ncbi:MAG: outer membrane beta-barrel protein [Imperialibacter sp.]|uniref:outer membrane beta-barrel protein n=1 Tax=Imperialibacter sp. TaxID=2038411 RepID=UPI0032EFC9A2